MQTPGVPAPQPLPEIADASAAAVAERASVRRARGGITLSLGGRQTCSANFRCLN
jgi:hypothetical protein